MINIYKSTSTAQLVELEDFEKGCWINLTNPTPQEIIRVHDSLNIDIDFLKAPLDDEESPRIEIDDYEKLIIVDVPMVDEDDSSITYDTLPLGIIITEDYIITNCLKNSYMLEQFEANKIKSFFTFKKNRFLFQILFKVATRYLMYLKQIDRISDGIEEKLHKATKNKELIQMFGLKKSLVYFSSSLKFNDLVMQKLLKLDSIHLYPEDEDLLEDVIIENRQAIEMTNIYSNVLTSTMETSASIILNNQNIVIKFLTTITRVMSIPNIISGFYGMNVNGLPFANNPYSFLAVIMFTIGLSGLIAGILAKKNMF